MSGAPGQLLIAYHAEPGSPSERSLALLGSLITDSATGIESRPAGTTAGS